MRGISTNTLWLLVARIMTAGLSFLLLIIVARQLGQEIFGVFTLALTISNLFANIADFGFGLVIVRDVARERPQVGKYLVNGLVIKSIISLIGLLALVILSLFLYESSLIRIAIVVASIAATLRVLAEFLDSFFNAHERMDFTSVLSMLRGIVIFLASVFLLQQGFGILGILYGHAVIFFFSAMIGVFIFIRNFQPQLLLPDLDFAISLFRRSIPFGVFILFGMLYFQADTVLLSILADNGEAQVGTYQAVMRVIMALEYLPDMLAKAVYPVLSINYLRSPSRVVAVVRKSIRYLLIVAFPVVVGSFLLADRIVNGLYGRSFDASIPVLRILILMLPLRYMAYIFGTLLSAADSQKLRTVTVITATIVNLTLNLWLIPNMGAVGAAVAMVATSTVMMGLYYIFVRSRIAAISLTELAAKPLISAFCMGVLIYVLPSIHLLLLIILATGCYFAIMAILGGVEREDYQRVKEIVNNIAHRIRLRTT